MQCTLFIFVDDVVSAYEIIKLKGYTSWAIGIMVSTLCSAILRNQRQLYTLCTNAKVRCLSEHPREETLGAFFSHSGKVQRFVSV